MLERLERVESPSAYVKVKVKSSMARSPTVDLQPHNVVSIINYELLYYYLLLFCSSQCKAGRE